MTLQDHSVEPSSQGSWLHLANKISGKWWQWGVKGCWFIIIIRECSNKQNKQILISTHLNLFWGKTLSFLTYIAIFSFPATDNPCRFDKVITDLWVSTPEYILFVKRTSAYVVKYFLQTSSSPPHVPLYISVDHWDGGKPLLILVTNRSTPVSVCIVVHVWCEQG